MESYLSEESLWASGLASRLRLIQTNFADDSPATRQNYIAEEIDRALKAVVPSKRKSYLGALAERFPAWQAGPPAPLGDPKAAAAPETPEGLLARLIELAPGLAPEAREGYAKKLQQAGLGGKPPAGAALSLSPEIQKKLGLAASQTLSAERAIKLLAAMCDLVLALDQLVWALWKQIAPRTNIRKEADIARLAGPYLSGDPEVSTQQMVQVLERTRRLIAGLIGAVGRAGSSYAKKHVARFAPEEIKILAEMEKTVWVGLEQTCWRKYEQLYREHGTEPAIENEIQETIAKTAENLIIGRAAG